MYVLKHGTIPDASLVDEFVKQWYTNIYVLRALRQHRDRVRCSLMSTRLSSSYSSFNNKCLAVMCRGVDSTTAANVSQMREKIAEMHEGYAQMFGVDSDPLAEMLEQIMEYPVFA